jgi:PiT family inorganic phosphate transporter
MEWRQYHPNSTIAMLFLVLTSLLAFYFAWNLGANDVANAMGTSVGSKAITLRQALIIAGILEFTGAVLFGRGVSETLTKNIVDPSLFASDPHRFALGMISALLACGIWLQIATLLGLPVSSSHAIVGAIAGFGWVAAGRQAVNWPSIGIISLTWIVTPLVSGAIAILFYSLIRRWILEQPNPIQQLYEWIPWLSAALVGVFGFIVLPSLFALQPFQTLPIPSHDISLILGAIAISAVTVINWRSLSSPPSPPSPTPNTQHPTPESSLSRFQVLSACFVAFAHGSNDVGNAVAPLAAIAYILSTGAVPLAGFAVPLWVLVLGGIGIVSGLAVLGKNVMKTIGEGITTLQPSSGFCAELAAATTTLLASRVGLPISTSHALVGAVVGIGLFQQFQPHLKPVIQIGILRQIALAWLVTIPFAAGLSAAIFAVSQQFWP